MIMAAKKPSIAQIAFELGTTETKKRRATEKVRNVYRLAPDKNRIRTTWLVKHLMGNLGIPEPEAMQIVNAQRTSRSYSDQKAYDRARAKFRYHMKARDKKIDTSS